MPVVRELVNRVSFKVNPGDIKNADNAFNKIKGRGSGLINFFGSVGGAITKATGAFALFQGAATKLFVDFERDTGVSNFFARNKKEADELLKVVDEIAKKSETTSRREARQASKIFSSLNIQQLEEIIPFIEKISIARPDLDFTDVAESLKRVVKGGDIQELINLVPGIKSELEALSKTTFQQPFGQITEEQRAELVLRELRQNQDRLDELVREQRETLNFQFSALAKQSSDFTLRFGETTALAVKDALIILKELITELNNSETFWGVVNTSVLGIRDGLKSLKETVIEVNKFFSPEETEKRQKKRVEGFKKRQSEFIQLLEDAEVKEFPVPKRTREEDEKEDVFRGKVLNIFKEGLLFNADRLDKAVRETSEPRAPGAPSVIEGKAFETRVKELLPKVPDQSLNINLGGTIRVENQSGQTIESMQSMINKGIQDKLSPIFKNITIKNGGFAAV